MVVRMFRTWILQCCCRPSSLLALPFRSTKAVGVRKGRERRCAPRAPSMAQRAWMTSISR